MFFCIFENSGVLLTLPGLETGGVTLAEGVLVLHPVPGPVLVPPPPRPAPLCGRRLPAVISNLPGCHQRHIQYFLKKEVFSLAVTSGS